MKLNEFIDKWVVAYDSKEQKEEYALEIVKDIESLEYRSQASELPSDDGMVVEILNKIIIHSKQVRRHNIDFAVVIALANECLILLSDHSPSPLIASRDARIKELEEENQKLKDYINPPKKDSFFDGLKVGQRD